MEKLFEDLLAYEGLMCAYVHIPMRVCSYATDNKERCQSSSAGTHSTRPPAAEHSLEQVKGLLRLSDQPPALPQPHLSPDEGPPQVGLKVTK